MHKNGQLAFLNIASQKKELHKRYSYMSANCQEGGRKLRVKNLGRTSLVTPCAVFTSSKGGGEILAILAPPK